jgi:hypothetical protein
MMTTLKSFMNNEAEKEEITQLQMG